MKAYIDTSVLTAAYCPEPGSERAEQALRECEPMISSLTRLEFSSAVARKLRARTLTREEAARIISQFHTHIREGVFECLAVLESHFLLANDWIDALATPLRTLDAMHLALAHASSARLITADAALAKSARTLRITAMQL